jgi:hypothetical protein
MLSFLYFVLKYFVFSRPGFIFTEIKTQIADLTMSPTEILS